jgi:hypothetical protein
VQPAPHAWNAYPEPGVACNDTSESSGKFAVHVPVPIPAANVQLMPGGVEITVPLPCPDKVNGTPLAVALPLKETVCVAGLLFKLLSVKLAVPERIPPTCGSKLMLTLQAAPGATEKL